MKKPMIIRDRKEIISALSDFVHIQAKLVDKFIDQYSSFDNSGTLEQQHMSFLASSSSRSIFDDIIKEDRSSRLNFNVLEKPKQGSISVLGKTWKFQRHGAGILFQETESKTIIDAHRGVIDHSKSFDSWRLAQYFESLNCSKIMWKSNTFVADDEDSLDKLLELLEQEHVVKLVSRQYKLYELC